MRRLALLLTLLATPATAETTFTIALRQDPDVLDPTLGSAYVSRIIYASMCEKLIDVDEHLNLIPQLATSWTYENPTHLVLTLRPGVMFQDGEPFDAAAVAYKIHRDQTLKGSMRVGEVNAIQSTEIIDPLHIRLILKAPSAPLLSMLADRAGIMISPKAAEAEGASFGTHPVCAGPYAFDGRVTGDSITLRRDPTYYDAANYHFDRVVFRPMPNSAVRLANLEAGSVDLVEQILPTDADTVRQDPRLKLAVGDGLAYTGINLNVANGPAANSSIGQDARIRAAFEASLDRAAINQVVYNGLFTPTLQANPPISPYYDQALVPPGRDLARARQLLEQAGAKPPIALTLTLSNEPDQAQVGEIIQSMAADAGFDVRLRTMEFASSLQAGYAGDFQAYLIGWSGRVDPDGNTWQLLHTGGTFNYGHWSNPGADALLDRARTEPGPDARRALYDQFWQTERQDLPLIYLWTAKNIVGMKRGVSGLSQNPDGLIRLRGVTLAP